MTDDGADALAYTCAEALQTWIQANLPPGMTSAVVQTITKRTTTESANTLPYPAP